MGGLGRWEIQSHFLLFWQNTCLHSYFMYFSCAFSYKHMETYSRYTTISKSGHCVVTFMFTPIQHTLYFFRCLKIALFLPAWTNQTKGGEATNTLNLKTLPAHLTVWPLVGLLQPEYVWQEGCCWLLWTEGLTPVEEGVQRDPAAGGSPCQSTDPHQVTHPSPQALSCPWRTPPCPYAGPWGRWNLLLPPS